MPMHTALQIFLNEFLTNYYENYKMGTLLIIAKIIKSEQPI